MVKQKGKQFLKLNTAQLLIDAKLIENLRINFKRLVND